MKSPITGNEITPRTEKRSLLFRGEHFEVDYTYIADSGEEFVTPEMGDANLIQVYQQYNNKYGTEVWPD